jgi:hypothetical protein
VEEISFEAQILHVEVHKSKMLVCNVPPATRTRYPNVAKLLITNNAFFIVQTAQSKTGRFRAYGVAEAPPDFQAGWSDCVYFSLFLSSFQLLIWDFRVSFCAYESRVPYRSSAQMSCRLMTKATNVMGD